MIDRITHLEQTNISFVQERGTTMRYLIAGLSVLAITLFACGQDDNPFGDSDAAVAETDPFGEGDGEPKKKSATKQAATTKTIKEALTKRASCDFFENSLDDALGQLGKQHNLQFHVDAAAMEAAGVDANDLQVNLKFKDIPLRSLIKHMLRPFDLGYLILEEDALVLVTTVEEAEAMPFTELYPVRNLLNEEDPNRSADMLIETIVGTVSPQSWEELGGISCIYHYQGILVVSSTNEVLHDVENLLNRLGTAIAAAGGPNLPMTSPRAKPVPVGSQGGFGGGGNSDGGGTASGEETGGGGGFGGGF